ncbi:bifunctional glutamine-synthetase adenylyltransferase/deadenyltransferase [Actinoalloteichus sp. AHMU CJ021]|uniref:bifunctional [glutamine synthetase] adenylyltransferase/[glutamine synthetase]-adenylyl-L-tyrosine phosphorylase n=1 Tax=Actinoalloteichus sp. AHMU CJ021 TaxID=2072503 RepID=UPI000CA02079|nr:bifunctional glutamine-synthetase adenylyltransferase/deadenyltransferase [Actinoalloteichus sp. AHMU CJ021]
MAEESRPAPWLGRFGLTDARTHPMLAAAGWWEADRVPPGLEPVLGALSASADPDLALRGLDRLRESLGADWPELDEALRTDHDLAVRLFAVLGASTALTDHLVAHPAEWRRLDGELLDDPPSERELTTELWSSVGAVGPGTRSEDPGDPAPAWGAGAGAVRSTLVGIEAVRALRTAYRGMMLDIAATDLSQRGTGWEPERYRLVAGALSNLAVAALRAALAVAVTEVLGPPSEDEDPSDAELPFRLAVIAMGKCGAGELNYVSDVDVVFVAEPRPPAEDVDAGSAGDEGDAAPHRALATATRVAAEAMRIAGEACFQVDAALRPEGKAGALVRTLEGHLSYYRRWARTWEFQALLKARPVAGDAALGKAYLDAVTPMVWTAADRDDFVSDVQEMRRRVEDNLPAELTERELKLGRGGLRDVEFAVQLLQLVHGRSDEELRVPGTVPALGALGSGGYVGRVDAAELTESYCFLRLLEHRLQLQRLLRTHLFPAFDDVAGLRWLARAAGLRSDGRRGPGEVLLSEFRRHAARVRRLHEKLFYRPLLEAVARVPSEALRLTPNEATARLAALGFTSPEGALRHIGALTEGVSRRASIQRALLPVLLDLFADTTDPDGGLLAYRRVSEALTDTPWYLRLLRDRGAVAERLAFLLGTSRMVPELLVRAPEVLRLLVDTPELVGRDPEEVAHSLGSAVARHGDPEQAVLAARSLRRHELLRVGCADLLGLMELPSVSHALSRIWSAVLEAALRAAAGAVAPRFGPEPLARVAVIGMGRLGGDELGYGSDADVLFVCEAVEGVEDHDAVRYATAVAETLRRLLSAPSQDPPLHVDTDLRPEGRSGPLVRTLESYRMYYEKWSDTWEAQALLRARRVAGDEELGRRFTELIDPVRYPAGGLDEASTIEIRRIKARVEHERLPRGIDPTTNTKLGRGGLSDVEWTAQLIQLGHAHEVPGLRTTSTLGAVRSAAAAGLLDEADAEALRAAWTMASQARNATTLVRGKASDQLPGHGRDLAAVARTLGYSVSEDPGVFVDDYRRVTRRARAVMERVFYGTG